MRGESYRNIWETKADQSQDLRASPLSEATIEAQESQSGRGLK